MEAVLTLWMTLVLLFTLVEIGNRLYSPKESDCTTDRVPRTKGL